ncbi:YheC/YheD family protein [Saccharibacillus sp. JS10]|uniref:YheC/YheD family protein n=1 Tax=Saccharibacillus sp. JS10 TaxID=2950552 RepID=UPI00210911FF|nr:YheC/YheD family protein [Saccharibacillus sp. JS10]MCQ4087992.1 YheC/YheD family protein [Saccharibacillus sp. JS10]
MLIGVYHRSDPFEHISRERIDALLAEAKRQHISLCFFNVDGIHPERSTITALHAHNDQFYQRETPYPDVVLNESPEVAAKRPEVEKLLRAQVPFAVHLIGNKEAVTGSLQTDFAEFLLPTENLSSPADAERMLNLHRDLLLKPSDGRRGGGIVRIRIDHARYRWEESSGTSRLLDLRELRKALRRLIARQSYLIQPYVPTLTSNNEPLDYRVHVQRDENGEFQVTRTYPRIGKPGGFISNLSAGGQSLDLHSVLSSFYGNQALDMQAKLEQTALRLAEGVNRPYPFLCNELGIDLLMDQEGKIHFLEANASPETRDHEPLRAIRVLQFCRHLHEVGTGQIRHRRTIGMLVAEKDAEVRLSEALAFASAAYDTDFIWFRPIDAAYDSPLLKAITFQYGQWKSQYRRLPDVVYDRLKERGLRRSEKAYARLEGIPNTHSRPAGSFNKIKAYEMLSEDPSIQPHLIPYAALNSAEVALKFISDYGQTVIKPSGGTKGSAIIVVQREGEHYRVDDPMYSHLLATEQLSALFEGLAENKDMVLQKFIHSVTSEDLPFHIRVHMIRDAEGVFRIIGHMPYISTQQRHKVVNHHSNLRAFTQWHWFLPYQFPGREEEMNTKIDRFAYAVAAQIEKRLEDRLWEIGLDLGIEQDGSIWLYEANMNKVGVINRELEAASILVPSCISLIGSHPKIESQERAL